MKRSSRGGRVALGLGALIWGWAACGPLDALEENRCGNRVVEPGEDCDTFEDLPGAERCEPVGSLEQCLYTCGLKEDGETRYACPSGWGCGSDDVCRRHSGRLELPLDTGQGVGRWFDLGDFDGDEQLDVVSVSDAVVSVDYLDGGVYRQSHRFPLEAEGQPSVADADLDGLTDLLAPTSRGLALLRGAPDRTLLPTTFSSLAIPLSQLFLFQPIDLVPDIPVVPPLSDISFFGDETVLIIGDQISQGFSAVPYAMQVIPDVTPLTIDVLDVEGRPVVGTFDEQADSHGPYTESPEQLVIATAQTITLYRPSYIFDNGMMAESQPAFFLDATVEAPSSLTPPPTHPSRSSLSLPAGHSVNGIRALQANRDGLVVDGQSRWPCGGPYAIADDHLDLVLDLRDDRGEPVTAIAFGLGDGRFHGDPCELESVMMATMPADDAVFLPSWGECEGPALAVGDVDGDGAPDVVTPLRLHLSGLIPVGAEEDLSICSPFAATIHPDNTVLTAAALGDFDGDGIDDVIATNTEASVDFFSTTAGVAGLQHLKLVTAAAAEELRLGDFDGDGLQDAVFSENFGSGWGVSVVWGEAQSVPTPPTLVAVVPELLDVEPMRDARDNTSVTPLGGLQLSATDDLIIATAELDESAPGEDEVPIGFRLAILDGRADRRLQAPFFYTLQVEGGANAPLPPYLPYGASVAPFDVDCDAFGGNGQVLFLTGGNTNAAATSFPAGTMGSACVDSAARFRPMEEDYADLGLVDPIEARGTAVIPFSYTDDQGQPVTEPIVALFNPAEGARQFSFHRPSVSGEGDELSWTLGPGVVLENTVPAGSPTTDAESTPTSLVRKWAPFVNNVPASCALWDGEDPGLVFLTVEDDGECPNGAVSTPAQFVLTAVPSSGVLGLRSGTLDGAATLRTDPDEALVGFACLNADGSAGDELVVLVLEGEISQCDELPQLPLYEAELRIVDLVDGELAVRDAPLATIPSSRLSLGNVLRPPASGLAAGDFNRDGVEDLFVATPANGMVWLGEPVEP